MRLSFIASRFWYVFYDYCLICSLRLMKTKMKLKKSMILDVFHDLSRISSKCEICGASDTRLKAEIGRWKNN